MSKKYKIICHHLFIFILFPILGFGQDTNQNWVKQIIYKTATANPLSNTTVANSQVSVTYLDGMGRPIQQIANGQAVDGKDIIVPIQYDDFGRQVKSYLPYVSSSNNMAFDSNPLSNIGASYPQFSGQNLYSETTYEASPLNRVLKQAAPGTDWAKDGGHEVEYSYTFNTVADQVRKFDGTQPNAILDNGFYAANELYKNTLKDENGHITHSFTNIKGQLILKRSVNGIELLDTYNVYDAYYNLSYVIPPKANGVINSTVLENLCYQYKYDAKNRLIEKKNPDRALWEYVVYDDLNRIVATGPSYSPFGDGTVGWLLTRYDVINRSCYTGWYPSSVTSATRATLQTSFTGITIVNVTKTTSGTIDGQTVYYTATSLPTGFKLLSVNYYDNYVFPGAPTTYVTAIPGQTAYYNNTTKKPIGLPTGSWTRVLTTGTVGETSYILYNYRGQPILTKKTNYYGGYTQNDLNLDFNGKTLYTITTHKAKSASTIVLKTRDDYTYSNQDRLLTHNQQITENTTVKPVELIAENTYTNLGQLNSKKVGNNATTPLQNVNYAYNIRGWLTSINNVNNLSQASDPKDLFAYKINYNQTDSSVNYVGTKQYNGNISETQWRTSSDDVLRKYNFEYDNVNRFLTAFYQKPAVASTVNSYGETVSYDPNGNITNMSRTGNFDSATQNIALDEMTYTYADNSNRLLSVNDTTNNTIGFKNGTNGGNDYTYDDFGNQYTDGNKNITSIKYNHLNQPTEIIFSNTATKKITYIYDAAGSKVQKVFTSGSAVNTTDYLDGYQYYNSVLKFFAHAEGYVNYDNNVYKYVYNYLDQVGNVRVSYTKNETTPLPPNTELAIIMEQNHYYPYGLKHTNYNINVLKLVGGNTQATLAGIYQYKYNGQEWQDELGLNMTAMDFRQYDNAIGRFVCQDPVTHYSQSPYQFGNGNPVFWADPSGLDGVNITIDWDSISDNSPTTIDFLYSWDEVDNAQGQVSLFGEDGSSQELLPSVTVYSNGYHLANSAIGIIQGHVYWNSKNYQSFRDKQNSKSLDDFQDGLAWLGNVPGYGEPIDFINAGISLVRGRTGEAALSLASMIPIAGNVAAVIRIQKHHIIPKAVYRDASKALQDFIDLNGGFNLKNLPTPFHGNHPQYNKYVAKRLENLEKISEGTIKTLQKDLNSMINTAYDNYKATGENLNDYFRQYN